ncbi:ABC transporter ATP-binding protein [Neorhizobium galegae]|uniref:ABC transporter ATP-binding protein n=1 Tax=Neorhizobium galegae TaxID=399 RepID=UPI00062116CF|nr:ABC transporter ATP-binding protein [Neorhizobium galegae]KAB1121941.1 ABC transporter ATP-binding protein [Neorhizobium galegae]MCQ1809378.1 ABC transporter ATP-binding protein [Neorhizobium galegae]CDZ63540.1 Spermidine/putrescine ABC transporter ATPase subunit [Neorhizobium galegae bv. orientalis]
MHSLQIEDLQKAYGATVVVSGLNLTVGQGEMVALLGPSGCGKSTTLRMVAGFVEPTAGKILLNGVDISHMPPHRRDTGMVFQSYALFPHMSVAANVGFGLEMRRVPKPERSARVAAALDMVRLTNLADRMPRQLSGGQQQRVALARALAVNPALLLLDEPLSNLDAKLRAEVQHEIRSLQQRLGLTTLIVTHDQEEALTMADRLVVMEGGRIRQVGTPRELYESPSDTFVAGFVGRCNLIEGSCEGAGIFRTTNGTLLPCNAAASPLKDAVLAIRPEHLALAPADAALGPQASQARITGATYLGSQTEYRLDLGGTRLIVMSSMSAPNSGHRVISEGDPVTVTWPTSAARVLPRT